MKNRNINSLIYKNYLRSALIPILVIEVTLLLLYFGINRYIAEKNQITLLNEATANIQEIALREVESIDAQLQEACRLALMMQRDHEAFFAHPEACYLPHGEPEFAVHANGAYYKSKDNGGAILYYSSSTQISPSGKLKARNSEILDPLLASIVDTSPIITQAYLNTWDDMSRLYPFIEDAPALIGASAEMENFNFYYEADAAHNPSRGPVWTGVYLDPAGQGWMVSVIVPIYHDDFLEGVSGLDVTVDSFVRNILGLQFPWGAGTFMVEKNGKILAMQEKVEEILGLEELKGHTYLECVRATIEKPEKFNLLKNPDEALREQLEAFFVSKERIGTLSVNGKSYLVSQEIVPRPVGE